MRKQDKIINKKVPTKRYKNRNINMIERMRQEDDDNSFDICHLFHAVI